MSQSLKHLPHFTQKMSYGRTAIMDGPTLSPSLNISSYDLELSNILIGDYIPGSVRR